MGRGSAINSAAAMIPQMRINWTAMIIEFTPPRR